MVNRFTSVLRFANFFSCSLTSFFSVITDAGWILSNVFDRTVVYGKPEEENETTAVLKINAF